MKEKKVSFWTFLKVVTGAGTAAGHGSSEWSAPIAAILLIGLIIYIGGNGIPTVCILAVFAIPSIMVHINATRSDLSLFNMMPIGPAKKTIFLFLSIVVYMFFMILISTVVIILVALLMATVIWIGSGEWIIVAEESAWEFNIGALGYLIGVIIFVSVTGLTMLFMSIDNKVIRRTLSLSVPVIVSAPFILLMSIYNIERGNLFVGFDAIPVGYIYIIVFAVISTALFIAGVIRTVKLIKPKNY